jgi:hypothetical protein
MDELAAPTKALSVRMPWAWCLVHARRGRPELPLKPVENRDMATKIRGRVFIHAGVTVEWEALTWIKDNNLLKPAEYKELERVCNSWTHGALIGEVTLTECTQHYPGPWFSGPYGYVMRRPQAFNTPITCKGQLGFFSVLPTDAVGKEVAREVPEPAKPPRKRKDESTAHHQQPGKARRTRVPSAARKGPQAPKQRPVGPKAGNKVPAKGKRAGNGLRGRRVHPGPARQPPSISQEIRRTAAAMERLAASMKRMATALARRTP